MNFDGFKNLHLKEEVKEYPNQCLLNQSLVTVRVLTYNHESFIARCLDSILMQKTSFRFDILIGEDSSSDRTREICIDYAKRHPNKIRLLLNSRKNNISVDGRPSGIFNAIYSNFSINSKYIAMCEGDDSWTDPTSLQQRVDFLEEHKDHVMCFHNSTWESNKQIQQKGRHIVMYKESRSIEGEEFVEASIPTATVVYRNHLIQKFDEKMSGILVGDIILMAKLSQFGKGRYLHNISPAIYTVHAGGMFSTLSFEQKFKLAVEARLYLLDTLKNLSYKDAIEQKIAVLYLNTFLKFLKKKKRFKITLLLKALSHAKKSKRGILSVFKKLYQKQLYLKTS
jgi:glycosyltransferase involved in cell wall biosynthesis